MKKINSILYFLTVFAMSCNIIESTGATKNSFSGGEAREIIRNAAFNADGVYYTEKFGGYSGLVENVAISNSLIVSFTLDLDDSKYYKRKKVTDCASDMEKFSYLNRFDSLSTLTLSENCRNFEEIKFLPN
ncbi:TIGR04452 family lipoprotein [Leptospira koniambonensis]|uniref:TIGR04452 family lipoprotein n=1 Tax=Leptospira koniambonensis TaxID=2484950 RepID=A0A4R9J3H8_9LEPT|nr:TIGR04452 family lipoprotein [Leptospira koniambonensis]TGL28210.1 TIGR04452 family lipoprotein [Leptospira koniambonensis]